MYQVELTGMEPAEPAEPDTQKCSEIWVECQCLFERFETMVD